MTNETSKSKVQSEKPIDLEAKVLEDVKKAKAAENFPRVRDSFATPRVQKHPVGLSRTKQSFKDDCDINAIVRRWSATGVLEHTVKTQPRYGDFSAGVDYLDALNRVELAQTQFMALPSQLREQHENDPGKFIQWAHDPSNRKDLEANGLGELAEHLHGPSDPSVPFSPPEPNPQAPEAPPEAPAEPPTSPTSEAS